MDLLAELPVAAVLCCAQTVVNAIRDALMHRLVFRAVRWCYTKDDSPEKTKLSISSILHCFVIYHPSCYVEVKM